MMPPPRAPAPSAPTRAALPLLAGSTAALETCGYCPKLCRAACPVSAAEPRDSLTPWGKMSLAWFAARGSLPPDPSVVAASYACTGCLACRERCDPKNPVAETLLRARADFRAAGLAPPAVEAHVRRHADRLAAADATLHRLAALSAGPGGARVDADATTALVVGCDYLRHEPAVAEDAVVAALRLAGPLRLVSGCCGAVLEQAGDRQGAEAARSALRERTRGCQRLVVVDPGCATALAELSPVLLVDLAARASGRLRPLTTLADAPLRWHDPCSLGRGLGRYEEPRQVLAAITGRPPAEFVRRREGATCSGGGGLLPLTWPEASRGIAAERLAQHAEAGGGTVVTHCAASLGRFRRSGAEVVDLATLLRRATEPPGDAAEGRLAGPRSPGDAAEGRLAGPRSPGDAAEGRLAGDAAEGRPAAR